MKKYLAIFLSVILLLPAFSASVFAVNTNTDDLGQGGTSGSSTEVEFISKGKMFKALVDENNLTTTSNIFDLPVMVVENEVDGPNYTSVTAKDAAGNTISLDDDNVLKNYNTGLSKSGRHTIELTISYGENSTDTVEIRVNYLHINTPGAKYVTDFTDKATPVFGRDISFSFAKDSFLTQTSGNGVVKQDVMVEVQQKPQASSDFVFISNVYRISNSDGLSSTIKPSQPGTLKLAYEGKLPSTVAKYNVAISKLVNGEWIPVGGVVTSSRNEVQVPLTELGTYAVTLNYRTFGLSSDSWDFPYIVGLTYKGIMDPKENGLPHIPPGALNNSATFKAALESQINRFAFVSMVAKGIGLTPQEPVSFLNGNFADVTVGFPKTTIPVNFDFNSSSTTTDTVTVGLPANVSEITYRNASPDTITIKLKAPLATGVNSILEDNIEKIKSLGTSVTALAVGDTITISLGTTHSLVKGDSFTINAVVNMGNTSYDSYEYDVLGYLQAAVNSGLLQGVGTNGSGKSLLAPTNNLTREQAAVFIARATNLKVSDINNLTRINRNLQKSFADDWDKIAPWARPYVEASNKAGYVTGTVAGKTFAPKSELTVNQSAALVFRAMENLKLFGK